MGGLQFLFCILGGDSYPQAPCCAGKAKRAHSMSLGVGLPVRVGSSCVLKAVSSGMHVGLRVINTTFTRITRGNQTVYVNLCAYLYCSNACGGQNHNINVACFWMHVVCSSEFSCTTISHKFMVSGHSYPPNDRDFRSIEKANRKRQHVYEPEEWSKLLEMCRKKKQKNIHCHSNEDRRLHQYEST